MVLTPIQKKQRLERKGDIKKLHSTPEGKMRIDLPSKVETKKPEKIKQEPIEPKYSAEVPFPISNKIPENKNPVAQPVQQIQSIPLGESDISSQRKPLRRIDWVETENASILYVLQDILKVLEEIRDKK